MSSSLKDKKKKKKDYASIKIAHGVQDFTNQDIRNTVLILNEITRNICCNHCLRLNISCVSFLLENSQ